MEGVIIGNKLWWAGNILREIVEKMTSTHGRLLEGKKAYVNQAQGGKTRSKRFTKIKTGWGGCYETERGGGGLFVRVSQILSHASNQVLLLIFIIWECSL